MISTILANLNRANFTFRRPKMSETPPKWLFFAFYAKIWLYGFCMDTKPGH